MESGGRGEGFGERPPLDGAGEAHLRVVPGIVGLGAMAGGFSAAAGNGANRAWAEIAQRGDLAQDAGAFRFQSGQGIGHRGSVFRVLINPQKYSAKKRSELPHPGRAPEAEGKLDLLAALMV